MSSGKRSRVTIMDVAREAGVSYSTVSRVINNYKHVSPEKRQRVLSAMTRLGYVVNQQARSLAGGRSQVIGLLVPTVGNSYIGQIMQGIDEELAAAQYDLMLYTTHRQRTKESVYVATLTRGMTDGLLLLLPLGASAYLETLRNEQFPYVVIDHQEIGGTGPAVVSTNRQGGYHATEYLIELGHRRIGHIAGTPELSSAAERLDGYQMALAHHKIGFDPALVVNGDFQTHSSYDAANVLLDLPQPPTAIFAGSDLTAFGAVDAIRNRGLSIPGDISVIGFDDLPEAASMHPALTTVRQHLLEMGRVATRMLLQYINDPDCERGQVVMDTELIVRDSCSVPKR
jgi:LacI family transcriptional regulator